MAAGHWRRVVFGEYWIPTKDGDARARWLFERHYSHYLYGNGRQSKLFVGPGEKLVLLSPKCDALFVWRKFRSANGQEGVNCAVFRNESNVLSSLLIIDAERIASIKWPTEHRFYTYVNPSAVRSSNPGCCFKCAGWHFCGLTKIRKLLIFEKCREV